MIRNTPKPIDKGDKTWYIISEPWKQGEATQRSKEDKDEGRR